MATRRVTLADVARRAGLSTSAASMILNGRPDTRLSPDAHARVNAAAKELGYRPNVAARALRTDKSLTIGFISDAIATTRFASGLIQGALEAARQRNHLVLLLETGGEPERESEAIEAVLDRQVDGIIFATMRARELYVPPLPKDVRVVMLNATSADHPMSVLPDEEDGGRQAVRQLIGRGHRAGIALIGHNSDVEAGLFRSETVEARIAGIRGEMKDAGIDFIAEESVWEWEPAGGHEVVKKLLAERSDVRALLCLNDRLAFGAYQALTEAGLRVPDDVSIVGFDNDELASYLRPGLTTIALPHEQMGRRAVEILLAGESGAVALVPMPVVARNSVADADIRVP